MEPPLCHGSGSSKKGRLRLHNTGCGAAPLLAAPVPILMAPTPEVKGPGADSDSDQIGSTPASTPVPAPLRTLKFVLLNFEADRI